MSPTFNCINRVIHYLANSSTLYLGQVGGELMKLAAGVHSPLVLTLIGKLAVQKKKKKIN